MSLPQRDVERRPPLEVVSGAARRPKPKISHWVLFAVAVIVAFFGLIYSRISLDRSAFEIQELETQIAIQEDRHFQLRSELAQIQDPARLEPQLDELRLAYPESRLALSLPPQRQDQLNPHYR